MKSQNKATKRLLSAMLVFSAIIVLAPPAPVLATNYAGTTTLVFSANPATLSGDSTPDVTITTTTTAPGASAALISAGKIMIELATDELGNPVPAASVVAWVALNDPGVSPDESGVTTLAVDLDALGFVCGTVGGFRAHYVTGGGKDKVDTHFSDEVDLTVECDCECEATETAFAYDASLGTCFLDIAELNSNRWGWTIGPLAEDNYTFDIYAGAGQCDIDNGLLVGQLHVSYASGTATVTYDMDSCRILTETHLYIGSDILPVGEDGEYTVAPGQYGNIHDGEDSPNAESDQYVIEGLSGDIYLIAHAVVCVEPEAVDAQ